MSLNLHSTVEELDYYTCSLEVSEKVEKISNILESNPKLPGVILLDTNRLVGLVSRKNFLEYMSRPYSLEIAKRRTIKSLVHLMKVQYFIIPKDTPIVVAAKKTLARIPELMNEPIIVAIKPGKYGIIDPHKLLVCQAKIHEYTSELLTQMYGKLDEANKKLAKTNRKLKYLARVDELTGVANRRVFNKYLQREWQRGLQQKMPLAVIICSLDYFKEYNDCYGSKSGDVCLQNIAETIRKYLGTKDNLIARYDGAKFAIALPNTDAISAAAIAENIRQLVLKLAIENYSSPISNYLTLSLGLASLLPSTNNSANDLTVAANSALDRAKLEGRNRKIIYNNSELIRDRY